MKNKSTFDTVIRSMYCQHLSHYGKVKLRDSQLFRRNGEQQGGKTKYNLPSPWVLPSFSERSPPKFILSMMLTKQLMAVIQFMRSPFKLLKGFLKVKEVFMRMCLYTHLAAHFHEVHIHQTASLLRIFHFSPAWNHIQNSEQVMLLASRLFPVTAAQVTSSTHYIFSFLQGVFFFFPIFLLIYFLHFNPPPFSPLTLPTAPPNLPSAPWRG